MRYKILGFAIVIFMMVWLGIMMKLKVFPNTLPIESTQIDSVIIRNTTNKVQWNRISITNGIIIQRLIQIINEESSVIKFDEFKQTEGTFSISVYYHKTGKWPNLNYTYSSVSNKVLWIDRGKTYKNDSLDIFLTNLAGE